jgi:hypothetical protein
MTSCLFCSSMTKYESVDLKKVVSKCRLTFSIIHYIRDPRDISLLRRIGEGVPESTFFSSLDRKGLMCWKFQSVCWLVSLARLDSYHNRDRDLSSKCSIMLKKHCKGSAKCLMAHGKHTSVKLFSNSAASKG